MKFRSTFFLRIGIVGLIFPGFSLAETRDFVRLRDYPNDLLRGVGEEVRPEGIVTLLSAGAGSAIARYGKTRDFDDFRISAALAENRPLGRGATGAGAFIGYPGYLMAAMGTTYGAGCYFDAREAQEFGLLGFEALSLAGIQTWILKVSVRRVRPDNTDRAAFPSGHAASSFSLASVAASKWGWRIGVPACLLAGFVGYTRMERRSHYFSDVLFGAGLGVVSGRAVYRVRRRAYPVRYAFAPYLSPGGGGVTVFFQ